jgi:NADPH:quinone reductase-like Zn-dependent oxidoreductase
MYAYQLSGFGIEHLARIECDPPRPGPNEVLVRLHALSLNFRDLLVVRGMYNPKLKLPATPISDGAGEVVAVGDRVSEFRVGDRVVSHFVTAWQGGPFQAGYIQSSLGTPGPGLAAELVSLPPSALVPMPGDYDYAQAATLPIAALTAWSSLVTIGPVHSGQTVLTLGTGGVSIFALQIARLYGANVIITSSSDAKLEKTRALGADHTINYKTTPDWEKTVVELTGEGVDRVIETGGAGTLDQSMRAVRGGGTLAVLGALTGVQAPVTTALILMKRLNIHGIYVDSRSAFQDMIAFIEMTGLQPVISDRFPFSELPAAFHHLEAGRHFGKVVVEMD